MMMRPGTVGRLGRLGLVAAAVRGAFAPFSPASLFANGEQGLWYDVSDLSTLFQDATGTIPVTAVEQPVGLILDKRLPRFDGSLAWTKTLGDGVVTVSGGLITITGATTETRVNAPGRAMFNGMVYMRVRYVNTGGAASPMVWIAGVPAVPVSGQTYLLSMFSHNSSLERVQIASGSATFEILEYYFLPGNHASQATTPARGVLRARYNLLTYSEDFSNPAWIHSNSVVSSNVVTAPNWDQTADAWAATATNNQHWFYSTSASQDLVGKVKCVMHVKPNGYSMVQFGAYRVGQSRWAVQLFNLSTDEITTKYEAAGATVVSSKIENLADGWKRITLVADAGSGIAGVIVCPIPDGVSTAVIAPSYTGDGSSGIYVWGAELRPANLPASLPPYQRIAAATDYDTVGFPVYLDPDGMDDGYQTGSIDFTATDKMTIWAGLRKVDDTARILCELGTGGLINTFYFATGADSSSFYSSLGRGNASFTPSQMARFNTGLYPAPESAVITATHDIAGDLSTIHHNGSSDGAIDGTGDKGPGNFSNSPIYLFSRGGTQFRWKGHFYSLVVRGAATDTDTIGKMAQVINEQMKGVY